MACTFFQTVYPDFDFHLLPMVTTGDKQASWSLQERGGKGLFIKEIEEALLAGKADIAVHSAKDLPTDMHPELCIAGYLPRGNSLDVLISRVANPRHLATGSPRRRAQAQLLFPNAQFSEIRGNVQTRIRKLVHGEAEGTFLAAAGLERLGYGNIQGLTLTPLSPAQMVPAVGQGAIAIQCARSHAARFAPYLDVATAHAMAIERQFLEQLGGGCQTALGAHFTGQTLHVFHPKIGIEAFHFPHTTPEAVQKGLQEIVYRCQS